MSNTVLAPDYFGQFQCLGGACHYNCCQGWLVTLTKQDYMRIRNLRLSGETQRRMNLGLKRFKQDGKVPFYAQITQDEETERCPLLDEEGLCSLQLTAGYKALPQICKTFPRIRRTAPHPLKSCSTACERVVELLLELPEGIRFHSVAQEKNEFPLNQDQQTAAQIAHRPILAYYSEIRNLGIAILQNRQYSLDDRMILLGMMLKEISDLEQSGDIGEVPQALSKKQAFANSSDLTDILEKLPTNPLLCLLNNLKCALQIKTQTNSRFCALLQEILERFHVVFEGENITVACDQYQDVASRFDWAPYATLLENLMVNDFFTYNHPFLEGTIWENYIFFCYFYSLLKFMIVGYMTPEKTEADLIQLVVACSRCIFNGVGMTSVKQFNATDSSTLAHMVIMVKS